MQLKSYTDLGQSKKLAEILPLKSADMCYIKDKPNIGFLQEEYKEFGDTILQDYYPCWSLAALLEYMNRNFYNISLNYCGSEYTISFDDNEKYKTITKDYSIDAVFEMVIWLKENNRL